MKKLIVPIIIGLVMFGAAFGGAFYAFRSEKAKEEAAIGSIRDDVLALLRKRGTDVVYSARVVAVASPAAAAAEPAEQPGAAKQPAASAPPAPEPARVGGGFAIVPATVRYSLDYRAIRDRDVVWDEKQRTVTMTLPALAIAEPEIDAANVRQIGGSAPLAAVRGGALGTLLAQAREDATLGRAREVARQLMQIAFSFTMQMQGVKKVKLVVRFADEPLPETTEGEGE